MFVCVSRNICVVWCTEQHIDLVAVIYAYCCCYKHSIKHTLNSFCRFLNAMLCRWERMLPLKGSYIPLFWIFFLSHHILLRFISLSECSKNLVHFQFCKILLMVSSIQHFSAYVSASLFIEKAIFASDNKFIQWFKRKSIQSYLIKILQNFFILPLLDCAGFCDLSQLPVRFVHY